MILDSSAMMGVIFEEDGHELLVETLAEADVLGIGAPTLFEAGMVSIGVFGLHGKGLVAQFLERWSVVVAPFDGRHWQVATEAFIRFGKGRHPARLNFGDCLTYATARIADEPLLFVGDDFARTDVVSALGSR